jgi:hypothetical protein
VARRQLEQRLERAGASSMPGAGSPRSREERRHRGQREVGRLDIGHLVPASGIETRASGVGRTE